MSYLASIASTAGADAGWGWFISCGTIIPSAIGEKGKVNGGAPMFFSAAVIRRGTGMPRRHFAKSESPLEPEMEEAEGHGKARASWN